MTMWASEKVNMSSVVYSAEAEFVHLRAGCCVVVGSEPSLAMLHLNRQHLEAHVDGHDSPSFGPHR